MTGELQARPMTIGQLSRRTGTPVKRLREYTDLGLIYTLDRTPAGYRLYDTDALWCVRFIGELRGLGLTITEICELTTGPDGDGQSPGPRLAELLQHSRRRLNQRITAQQQTLHRIERFEAERQRHLTETDLCWAGDPRCPVRA